jgi:hypothetical protein
MQKDIFKRQILLSIPPVSLEIGNVGNEFISRLPIRLQIYGQMPELIIQSAGRINSYHNGMLSILIMIAITTTKADIPFQISPTVEVFIAVYTNRSCGKHP